MSNISETTTANPAETYESYMVPALFAPWASHLVQSARPQSGQRILDVGCGTGIVARSVAPHVGRNGKVVGLDLNSSMLVVARTAAEREGLAIEWYEGRAERLPFSDGSFDLVLCQTALMFFADRRAALGEMRRVLADGGNVWLSVLQSIDRHPFYQALDEAIQQRLGASGVQEIFALGDADELAGLLLDAGFQHPRVRQFSMTARFPDPEGFLAGEIDVDTAAVPSMQHLDAPARRELTAAIRTDMETPLREVTQDGQVVIPFHLHVAHAQR
jgi:ubiquinone/menaquinone biosynthesis C-methylase UbiE